MRVYREAEIRCVHDAFSKADWDRRGSISSIELPGIFESLGYLATSAKLIDEISAESPSGELLFEDVVVILDRFQEVHGFLRADLDNASKAHDEYDWLKTGGLDHAGLVGAIRSLGFPVSALQVFNIKI